MKPNISQIKTQINALHNALAAKTAERRELTEQIEAINSAPPDRQAVIELLHGYIDEQANYYPASLQQQIAPFLANWSKGDYLKSRGLALMQCSAKPMIAELGMLPPPNGLFYLLREPLKAAIAAAVDEIGLPEGMPTIHRRTQLDALTTRLDALDSELRELFDECSGLGIALPDTTLSATERETRRRAAAAERAAHEPITHVVSDLPGDNTPRNGSYQHL